MARRPRTCRPDVRATGQGGHGHHIGIDLAQGLRQPTVLAVLDEGGRLLHVGYFYVVDRLKELIKYKGHQVAPAELEAVLLAHPAVVDAAVVALPDPTAGEVPKGFVVVRGELDAESLIAWVAERVAPYKRLRALEFVAEIPKSPSGKILRRVLRNRDQRVSTH